MVGGTLRSRAIWSSLALQTSYSAAAGESAVSRASQSRIIFTADLFARSRGKERAQHSPLVTETVSPAHGCRLIWHAILSNHAEIPQALGLDCAAPCSAVRHRTVARHAPATRAHGGADHDVGRPPAGGVASHH